MYKSKLIKDMLSCLWAMGPLRKYHYFIAMTTSVKHRQTSDVVAWLLEKYAISYCMVNTNKSGSTKYLIWYTHNLGVHKYLIWYKHTWTLYHMWLSHGRLKLFKTQHKNKYRITSMYVSISDDPCHACKHTDNLPLSTVSLQMKGNWINNWF